MSLLSFVSASAEVPSGILDADGKHVVANLLDRFGIEQQVIEYELSNAKTEIRIKNEDTLEAIEDALGNVPFSSVRAFCGRNFWRKLLTLPTVKETFLNTAAAAALRGEPRARSSRRARRRSSRSASRRRATPRSSRPT